MGARNSKAFQEGQIIPQTTVEEDEAALKHNPEEYANPFSRLIFQWIQPVISTGYKRPLQKSDLFILDETKLSQPQARIFEREWHDEAKKEKPSLFAVLNRMYGRRFWMAGLLRVVSNTSDVVAGPLLLEQVTKFVAQSRYAGKFGITPPSEGFGYSLPAILLVAQMIGTLCMQHHFHITTQIGMLIRSTLVTGVYKKALNLSAKARQEFTSGKIVNLMSTDTSRLEMVAVMFHGLWSAPFQIFVALGLLIRAIGPSALAGFGFMLLFGPIQGIAMKKLVAFRKKAAAQTDKRVRLTQEILQGIRIIKFFAWEKSFLHTLQLNRIQELVYARTLLIIQIAVFSLAMTVPVFASMISFLVYSATGNELTPATIFSALALFNAVRIPLMLLPGIIAMVTDAKVSLGRMQSLLLADELEELPPIDFDAKHAIEVRDGAFEWEVPPPKEKEMTKQEKKEFKKKEKEEKRISKRMSKRQSQVQEKSPAIQEEKKTPSISSESDDAAVTKLSDTTLAAAGESKAEPALAPPNSMIDNLNLRVNRGELLAIVGPVGSGKSSVLGALVGEMKRNAGQVVFGGTLGYCPQTAWIQNATVRDNITFGLPYDEAKYRSILRSCALEQDLSILPDGDQTEIGERGVNLSGGQKQRINIARAVYFDSDIVLLDDPFSALDSHTGRAVFENCLLGSLKGKTRVLVTHQLHFLSSVDRIIVMNRGQVVEVGSYRELMEANGDFAELMREYGGAQDEEEVVEAESAEIVALKKAKTREVKDDKQGKGQALMTGEERATGAVNNNVYLAYFRAGGVLACIWLLIAMVLSQVMRVGSDLWLSWWSSGNFGLSNGIYMGVYAAWGGAQALFNLISGVSFAIIGIVAARKLHNAAVDSVIRAPSSFYDTTPLGRIINRFSKDVDAVDFTLANSFRMFMVTLLGIFSTFILISVIFPIYLAPLAPLLVFYWYFQAYYRSTSRELKRLDSIARSPLYAHFSESLTGLSTLRAYRVQDRFIDLNQKHQDASNRAFYLTLIIQRWLAIRLDVIANLLTFFVMLFAVIFRNTVDPGLVGLVISYSLQVSGSLNWTVRQAAEVETNMNSVERLDHYAKHIDQEPPAEIPSRKPPPTWPSSGSITFTDVELAYRPGLPRVLHGISFHINGGEKIGIVGRTGSGKSTIMMALFRIVELSGGNIHVDDVDIGSIGLADLRGRIAIIPQDPTLFNGTFRSNLDPFGTHTDQELWESLESADLKQYVSEQASGLDAEVYEGGENLSAGQRQLLCLARAMLRKPRILVMDEATASVDLKTDALLQRAIRNDFNCTILTIAHRLNTVIDYDRVLVLDNGTIKEFDSPGRLLENPESVFSKMVMETGAANSTLLKSQAKY